jgi:hypothetical protein
MLSPPVVEVPPVFTASWRGPWGEPDWELVAFEESPYWSWVIHKPPKTTTDWFAGAAAVAGVTLLVWSRYFCNAKKVPWELRKLHMTLPMRWRKRKSIQCIKHFLFFYPCFYKSYTMGRRQNWKLTCKWLFTSSLVKPSTCISSLICLGVAAAECPTNSN